MKSNSCDHLIVTLNIKHFENYIDQKNIVLYRPFIGWPKEESVNRMDFNGINSLVCWPKMEIGPPNGLWQDWLSYWSSTKRWINQRMCSNLSRPTSGWFTVSSIRSTDMVLNASNGSTTASFYTYSSTSYLCVKTSWSQVVSF